MSSAVAADGVPWVGAHVLTATAEDTAYLDGVLFDSTSAQIVLAASAAGALVMAARAATRKEG